jgi:hypothetical protein
MAYFTVLEDLSDGDRREAAENALFIKEGFSWVALCLPVIWPLFYGQVGSFLVLLGGMVLLGFMVISFDLPLYIGLGILLAANLLVAFEANTWRRHIALRKGLQNITIAEGSSRKNARQRFLAELSVPTLDPSQPIQSVEEQVREAVDASAPTIEEIQEQSGAPGRALSVEQTLWTFLGLRDRPFVEDRGAVGPPDFAFSLDEGEEDPSGRRPENQPQSQSRNRSGDRVQDGPHGRSEKGTRRPHRRRR